MKQYEIYDEIVKLKSEVYKMSEHFKNDFDRLVRGEHLSKNEADEYLEEAKKKYSEFIEKVLVLKDNIEKFCGAFQEKKF